MSHIWMCHVTHMNESCRTHAEAAKRAQIEISRLEVNKTCRTSQIKYVTRTRICCTHADLTHIVTYMQILNKFWHVWLWVSQIEIPQYKFKLNQNLNLSLYCEMRVRVLRFGWFRGDSIFDGNCIATLTSHLDLFALFHKRLDLPCIDESCHRYVRACVRAWVCECAWVFVGAGAHHQGRYPPRYFPPPFSLSLSPWLIFFSLSLSYPQGKRGHRFVH